MMVTPTAARSPHSRQPILNLPTAMPDGRKTKMHPFLWVLHNRMPKDWNKSDLARALKVQPQSLYKWERACKEDRNFPLPVIRASQLARIFGVHPSLFRPDVSWSHECNTQSN